MIKFPNLKQPSTLNIHFLWLFQLDDFHQIFTLQNGWKSPFPYFPSIKKGLFGVPGNSLVSMVGLDKPRDKVKLWSNGRKNSKQMVVMPPFSIISIGSAHSKIRFYWLINHFIAYVLIFLWSI